MKPLKIALVLLFLFALLFFLPSCSLFDSATARRAAEVAEEIARRALCDSTAVQTDSTRGGNVHND